MEKTVYIRPIILARFCFADFLLVRFFIRVDDECERLTANRRSTATAEKK